MLNDNQERELCYVVSVEEIRPLEGYDRVEYARIGAGWWVVVRKDQFKVGDLAIYFEIDSKVPEREPFMFLESKKFRVRTQKMCRVVSQGLLMSAEDFGWKNVVHEIRDCEFEVTDIQRYITDDKGNIIILGSFLTKQLGVTYYSAEDEQRKAPSMDKYQKMVLRHKKLFKNKLILWLYGKQFGKKILFKFFGKKKDKKTDWPSWVVKTDEERCLLPQTKINTDVGPIMIEKIVNQKMPLKVLSVNKSGEFEYKEIIGYQKVKCSEEELMTIRYRTSTEGKTARLNSICCTKDHKFYTQRGFVEAQNLTSTDLIYTNPEFEYLVETKKPKYNKTDRLIPINIVSIEEGQKKLSKKRKTLYVYDITVKDNHNFFADGILTHNCQNLPYLFPGNDEEYVATEKVDGCLDRNVSVVTDCGIYKISDIVNKRMPVNVLTYNEELHKCEYSPIESYHKWERISDMYDVVVEQRGYRCGNKPKHIRCTSEHSFYVGNNLYKKAKELTVNDTIFHRCVTLNGSSIVPIKIVSIDKISDYSRKYVFDLTVGANHNYFANGVLTHNTSTTFTVKGFGKKRVFLVCSRNVVFDTPEKESKNYYKDSDGNVYLEMCNKYSVNTILGEALDGLFVTDKNIEFITVQAETFGGNIQKRSYSTDAHDLRVFNVIFGYTNGVTERLNPVEGKKFAEKVLHMPYVPIVDEHFKIPATCEELLILAGGKSEIDGGMREGLVFRSYDGKRSFKAVDNEFLLKYHSN